MVSEPDQRDPSDSRELRICLPMKIMGVLKGLPDLSDFYMAGHWVDPDGISTIAAASGKNVIQLICGAGDKAFETGTPFKIFARLVLTLCRQ